MSKKILLVQLRQLGDIILTTPSLREIKRAWPDAEIDFLCHPMGKLILQGNPYLKELLTYDPKGGLSGDLSLIRKLRKKRYDLVLDFMYNPRSALYSFLTGAPRRLAFPSRRQIFFTDIVQQNPEVEYIVDEKFRYLRYLGIEPKSRHLDLPWDASHLAPLKKLEEAHPEWAAAPYRVVLSCTHRRDERQWPKADYAAIADRLVREKNASILWIWGPGEEEFVDEAMALCKERTLKSPPTSFRELAALLANCDLFIGNSNGPSHVAVSVGIATLQLHGPTYAKAWCPATPSHRFIQAGEDLPGGRGPISLIPVEEVWQTLGSMWAEVESTAAKRRNFGVHDNWMHHHS